MTTTTEATSIYHAIGGRAALVAAVDDFYVRLLADPELAPFSPMASARGTGLTWSLSSVRPWAVPSATADSTWPGAHGGLGITDAQFDRTAAAHLSATLDGLGVPRHLADDIIAIVATLRPAVVTA